MQEQLLHLGTQIHAELLGWIPALTPGMDVGLWGSLCTYEHLRVLCPGCGTWEKLCFHLQVSNCSPSLLQTHLLLL